MRGVSEKPLAEQAEDAAASACPYCDHRPVRRDYVTGEWSCGNCGETGRLMFTPGRPPRESAVPQPLEFDR